MNKEEIEAAQFTSCVKEETPSVFIQYKGTNICMDFYCDCGAHCHFDGDFAYTVKCPHCDTVWEMPSIVIPKRADKDTYPYWRDNPKILEPDSNLENKDGTPVKINGSPDGRP